MCVSGFCPGSLADVLHHSSLPSSISVRERKGRKLSGSEFSQWAGHSDSCCVTEVGWLLESSQVKLQDQPTAAQLHVEMRNISLGGFCGSDETGIVFSYTF